MRIGIDPGITGMIALLNSKLGCLRRRYAGDGAERLIKPGKRGFSSQNDRELSKEPVVAFVERVNAMPEEGVSACFNFGMGSGIIQGVLATERVPFILVTPQQWKKRARLLKAEKDKSRTVAQQLYPRVDLLRKGDIGRAEAILIARFGERNY